MSMGFTGTGGLKPEINVTPLIDVLLVLLIIFLMIQPAHKSGLPTEVPQQPTNSSAPPPVRTIVLELLYRDDGRPQILINHDPTIWAELQEKLRGIFKSRAEKIMFVKGDEKLMFSEVAEVMDIARGADAAIRVGLITHDLQNGD
jgi:biopolymer transport protein ExbD